ncbi:MAG: ChbG/HpnK family deacetylase [Gemmatimonadota bacterium]|nr:ChbG/HpnK family deacetylase [Gemmatimonadota bacterium]
MKAAAGKAVISLCLFLILSAVPGAAGPREIRLIIRGDDLGMTQGSLPAFEKALNQGVLTCASIVVPGPWFEGAAELCRKNPGWCTGVHLCLVGEWRGMRWRPVLPWDKVSSIVDEDGFLYGYPDELFARKPKLEELEAELRAQVELAKKKGINVQYIDTHYLSPSDPGYPGLAGVIRKIGADYNIPVSGSIGEQGLSIYQVPVEERQETAVKMLEELEPGLWCWVCHPGIDSPEQHALIHTAPGHIKMQGVGRRRTEMLNVLTSLELKSVILKEGIILTDYKKLWKQEHKR